MRQFVCRFAQQWESFRLPELESVAKMQNVTIQVDSRDYSDQVRAYVHCVGGTLPSFFSVRF